MGIVEFASGAGIAKLGLRAPVVDGEFMRRLQRVGKRTNNYSARVVASKFGVTRATFKGWQTGKKVITAETARRALSLYREWARDETDARKLERDVIRIQFARGCDARMKTLKISRKPRRCIVCNDWFVPAHSRHVRCGECGGINSRGGKRK